MNRNMNERLQKKKRTYLRTSPCENKIEMSRKRNIGEVYVEILGIWILHSRQLVQIYFFYPALNHLFPPPVICKEIKHSLSRTWRPTLGVIFSLRTKWKCQLHNPAALTLGNNLGTHWIGSYKKPRASLDVLKDRNSLETVRLQTSDLPVHRLFAKPTTPPT